MARKEEEDQDHYGVLELSRDCTENDIKRNFQRLIKKYHPDKLPQDVSQTEREAAVEKFHKITWAHSTLSDAKKKLEYDRLLNANLVTQKWPVSDTVDLDDMTFEPSTGSYWSPCRCSGRYEVGEEELEEGVGLVCCTTCSLSIKITYQRLEDQ